MNREFNELLFAQFGNLISWGTVLEGCDFSICSSKGGHFAYEMEWSIAERVLMEVLDIGYAREHEKARLPKINVYQPLPLF